MPSSADPSPADPSPADPAPTGSSSLDLPREEPAAPPRVLLAAGTGTYASGEFDELDKVPESLRRIVEAAGRLGVTPLAGGPGYLLDPDSATLGEQIAGAAHSGSPVVIVYYTGHGEQPKADSFYVLTRNSTRRPPAGLALSAVRAADLGRLLVRRDGNGDPVPDQPAVLVILDCCYSGAGGMDALVLQPVRPVIRR